FALPPHPDGSDGSINTNYPSVLLEDPEAVLARFSHESVISIEGTWARESIRIADGSLFRPATSAATPLINLLRTHEPLTGWLPSKGSPAELNREQMLRLFDNGTVLWRVDVPVSTQANEPTTCTYVVASDAERARRILGPLYSHSLVVQQSSYSRDQIDRAQASLAKARWVFYAAGQGLSSTGDIEIRVHVPHLTPELVQWVESQPEGLIALRPWIRLPEVA
ncbi:MAG: hypothetical protein ACLGH7_05235, partial [Actinomycetes bacterium]